MQHENTRQTSQQAEALLPHEAALSTRSWIRLWWLERLRGYRVTSVVEGPQRRLFGFLPAKRIWWLEENQSGNRETE